MLCRESKRSASGLRYRLYKCFVVHCGGSGGLLGANPAVPLPKANPLQATKLSFNALVHREIHSVQLVRGRNVLLAPFNAMLQLCFSFASAFFFLSPA